MEDIIPLVILEDFRTPQLHALFVFNEIQYLKQLALFWIHSQDDTDTEKIIMTAIILFVAQNPRFW